MNFINIDTNKKKIIIISSIVLGILLILGLIYWIITYNMSKFLNIDEYYKGISVENVDISELTKEQAIEKKSEMEKNAISNIKIDLKYEDKTFYLSGNDFKFNYDTDEVLEKAYNIGRKGNLFSRYKTVKNLEKDKKIFDLTATADEKSIQEQIDAISKEINQDPVKNSVKFTPNEQEMFTYIEGHDGKKVNSEELLKQIKESLSDEKNEETKVINIPVTAIPHESKSIEELKQETSLIAKFSTVSSNNANGNSNMALAMRKINGTVLQPKETFSYNNTLGDTTSPAGGWLPAGAIENGKLIQSYGGGICQGSTTLYGAVLRAGLEITERSEHGFPIGYVNIGQDAAVSSGWLDFQFTNNYDTPIYIKSYMYGVTLTVEIYGKKPAEWDEITVSSQTTQVISPPAEQIIQDNTLPKGERVVEKEARTGYRATAQRHYYKNGALIKSEDLQSSYYAPVQGIVKVGTKEPPAPPVQ